MEQLQSNQKKFFGKKLIKNPASESVYDHKHVTNQI